MRGWTSRTSGGCSAPTGRSCCSVHRPWSSRGSPRSRPASASAPRTTRAGSRPRSPRSTSASVPSPSSATWPRSCTSPATASSRPPGSPSPTTAPAGWRRPPPHRLVDLGCGIGGDLIAFCRAGITAAGVDLDPLRVAVAGANLDALGLGGAVKEADATSLDTTRVRCGVRRPRASYRSRPDLRHRRMDAALELRRAGAPRRRLRQGRTRHPARPCARRASRPSG